MPLVISSALPKAFWHDTYGGLAATRESLGTPPRANLCAVCGVVGRGSTDSGSYAGRIQKCFAFFVRCHLLG